LRDGTITIKQCRRHDTNGREAQEKFSPDWEPRYLAAPGAWSMPIVLAEIAVLTSTPLRRDAS
jgi:hypothetical protein